MNAHDQRVQSLFKWAMFLLSAVCFMKTGESIVLNHFLAGLIYAVFGSLSFSVVTFLEYERGRTHGR